MQDTDNVPYQYKISKVKVTFCLKLSMKSLKIKDYSKLRKHSDKKILRQIITNKITNK